MEQKTPQESGIRYDSSERGTQPKIEMEGQSVILNVPVGVFVVLPSRFRCRRKSA